MSRCSAEDFTGSCSIAKKKRRERGKVGCGCPWLFFTCPKILSTQDPPNPSSHVSNEDARLSFAHHQASGVCRDGSSKRYLHLNFLWGVVCLWLHSGICRLENRVLRRRLGHVFIFPSFRSVHASLNSVRLSWSDGPYLRTVCVHHRICLFALHCTWQYNLALGSTN
jgi:hypothetical protein